MDIYSALWILCLVTILGIAGKLFSGWGFLAIPIVVVFSSRTWPETLRRIIFIYGICLSVAGITNRNTVASIIGVLMLVFGGALEVWGWRKKKLLIGPNSKGENLLPPLA